MPLPKEYLPVPEPMKTNLLYWNDDLNYVDLKDRLDANLQYYPHETDLDLWVFLETWVLTTLQIGILGPFVWIFSFGVKSRVNWFKNMEFIGTSSSYALSIFIWAINFMICWCRWYWKYDAFDIGYFFVPVTALLVRSASIAAKYATFSPRYRARLKGVVIPVDERREQFLLGGWSNQDHHFAESELYNAIQRRVVDDATFKVAFMTQPSGPALEFLDEVKHANQAIGETRINTTFGSTTYFDCKSVLYALINYHEKTRKRDWIFMVYIFFGIILGFASGITRGIVKENFAGKDELEVLFFYIGMILYTMLCIFINVFFITAYMDYDRVVFCMNQMSQMYSPDTLTSISEKVFPTINLADAVSLQSWINMRKVLMCYGKPYLARHRIFTSMLFAVSGLSGAALLATSWLEDSFEVTGVTNGLFKLVGPLSLIFLFYGMQFLFIARKFQLINDQTNLHIELVRENQQIFQTFHHFRDFYIGESADKELPY